ncbi:hypothetical protein Tco_0603404 [Tanacetum coccineum]
MDTKRRVRPHKGVKASANSDVMYFFTSAQDGDPLQDDVRLCLGDDLKKAQDHSQRQVASCSRGELLYTKQRVAYQRFAYQRFEQVVRDSGGCDDDGGMRMVVRGGGDGWRGDRSDEVMVTMMV